MKSTLKKIATLGIVLVLTVFLAGCYTQLANFSSTEESYTASKSYEGSQQSTYENEQNVQQPAETDTEYYPSEQEQTGRGYDEEQEYGSGTTNIYNFYSPTYPYGTPYWSYSWWGNPWFDYPPYDGFYLSIGFGSPYYYDPFVWDWPYPWYYDTWYSPFRYRYSMWYREWRYGYDPYNWWWYDSYTYERQKMKRRPFGRREGLERRGLLSGPVAIGGGMGGGSATGLNKPMPAPNRNRPGLVENPARIPKRKIRSNRTDDAIRISKKSGGQEIISTRIRKAQRAPNSEEGLVVRHPKRTRKIRRDEEIRTRRSAVRTPDRQRKVRINRARRAKTSEPQLYKTRQRRPHYRPEPKIRTQRTRSTPKRSTRVRYTPPRREYHPVIRHRSTPSRSYSPPPSPRTSQPAVRTPRSSSSSSSGSHSTRSRRERK